MVTVTVNISEDKQLEIVSTMCNNMRGVTSITPRSKRQLLSLLRSNNIALAFDDDTLIGWLVAVPYSNKIQELCMAYITPDYRKQGILSRMIDLLADKRTISLAVTYETRLAELLTDEWEFAPSSLRQFTFLTHGKFISDRLRSLKTIKAVFSHVSRAKPIYLIRNRE